MPEIDRSALRKRMSEHFDPAMWRQWCFLANEIADCLVTQPGLVSGLGGEHPNATLGPIPNNIEHAGLERLARVGMPHRGLMKFYERQLLALKRTDADDMLRKADALEVQMLENFKAKGTAGEVIAIYTHYGERKAAALEAWIDGEWHYDRVILDLPDGSTLYIVDVIAAEADAHSALEEKLSSLREAPIEKIDAAISMVYDEAKANGTKAPNIVELPKLVQPLLGQQGYRASLRRIQERGEQEKYSSRRLKPGMRPKT